mmetsp:Transcript_36531/g.91412  ORF Transcript_36531/g.91412 Transcript_36531/m.91412 type:complete len:229 (+) Transcript_36531:281-967(+)
MTEAENMSAFSEQSAPPSGGAYPGVPMTCPCTDAWLSLRGRVLRADGSPHTLLVRGGVMPLAPMLSSSPPVARRKRARPKSPILSVCVDGSTMMLSGLRSRCTMPFWCMSLMPLMSWRKRSNSTRVVLALSTYSKGTVERSAASSHCLSVTPWHISIWMSSTTGYSGSDSRLCRCGRPRPRRPRPRLSGTASRLPLTRRSTEGPSGGEISKVPMPPPPSCSLSPSPRK